MKKILLILMLFAGCKDRIKQHYDKSFEGLYAEADVKFKNEINRLKAIVKSRDSFQIIMLKRIDSCETLNDSIKQLPITTKRKNICIYNLNYAISQTYIYDSIRLK